MTEKHGLLTALGVEGPAEELYRALLASPGSTEADLRKATGFSPTRLRRLLGTLERRAMVTRRSGTPARFQPTPPDIVVDALVSAREHELDQARLAAHQLTSLMHPAAEQLHVTEVVEVLTTETAVAERWLQLQNATRSTLEVFVRPPYAQTASEDLEPLQSRLRARGVLIRGIYDADSLSYAGDIDHLRRVTRPDETGSPPEQARVVSKLPIKLALFDRRTALVPLTGPLNGDTVDAGLVVHRSALLDALLDLFNTYWQRGTNATFEEGQAATGRLVPDEDPIVTLLGAGLKDETIARELGVSTHTVRRRISDIKNRLGVTTRFQAGLVLGRQSEQSSNEPPELS